MKVEIKADFYEALSAQIEFDYPKQVEIVIDVEILKHIYPVPEDNVIFFVTSQPEGAYNKLIKEHPEAYNYLLTPFPELLELKNSHLFCGCGSFLDPDPCIKKKMAISTIMSGRNCLPGHPLRFELYHRRKEIRIPLDFYLGTHNLLPEEYYTPDCIRLNGEKKLKVQAMDCMFHIAIDSYKKINHYSEKLIDCFLTYTIPIYWGCTNIGDFFDKRGIIEVDSVDEIIQSCNWLNKDLYYARKGVHENYCLALEQYNYGKMLERAIKSILWSGRSK